MLRHRIWRHVQDNPGCTELEIAQALFGSTAIQQRVNPHIRSLVANGFLSRDTRARPFTYIIAEIIPTEESVSAGPDLDGLSEDQIKEILRAWLEESGYRVKVALGRERGIDIEAVRDGVRRVIEVKGTGSRPEMRVNYFLCMLGEVLQRFDDPNARYSIAMPDLAQYRGLWNRLPTMAKERLQLSAIFVGADHSVREELPPGWVTA